MLLDMHVDTLGQVSGLDHIPFDMMNPFSAVNYPNYGVEEKQNLSPWRTEHSHAAHSSLHHLRSRG